MMQLRHFPNSTDSEMNSSYATSSSSSSLLENSEAAASPLSVDLFEPFFRVFCIINVVSFFVIVSFLKRQRFECRNLTSYRIYCISLACSDLILSVDGFFAVSELDFMIQQEWILHM